MKITKNSVFDVYLDNISSEFDEKENRHKNLTIKRKTIPFNAIGMELLAKHGFIENFVRQSNQLYNLMGENGPESIFGLDLTQLDNLDSEDNTEMKRESFVSYLNSLLPIMRDDMDNISRYSEEMENMIIDFTYSMCQLVDGVLNPEVKAIHLSYETFKVPFDKYATEDMKEAMDKFYSSLN